MGETVKQGLQVYEPSPLSIAEMTPVSASLPPDLSFGDWCAGMRQLGMMEKAVHWWIGDYLVYAGKRYGETYKEAQALTGFDVRVLKIDKHVSSKVQKLVRNNFLSWSHHKLVAPLEQDEQIHWLAQAERNDWSVAELRQEIKDEKRKQTIDADIIGHSLPPTDDENCLFKDDKIQLWHSIAQDLYFIPDDSIDLIVTSPPYNIGRKTGNGRILWGGVAYGDDQDAMPEDEYQDSQLLALAEMWRVARPGASLFYNHKVRNRKGIGIHPLEWLLKTEWTFRQEITWDRGSTHNHEMTYFWPVTELVFWLTKGTQGVYLSPEGAEMTTVWRFNFKTNTDHPAPFPQELPARCIRAASKIGETVLDPFGGSMTTCFMANQLGRLSIGVDRNREYLTKAALRCSQKVLL